MAGVFISYSRTDQELARRVALGLRSIGVEVLWDQDMPSTDWQRFLERKINELPAVVVLWTPASLESDSVRDEARLAKEKRKLINLLAATERPPFPFDGVNGLPIEGWNAIDDHDGWKRLIASIDEHLAQAGSRARGDIVGAFARQRAELKERQSAIQTARRALQHAIGAETEARAAVSHAEREAATAETQLAALNKMAMSATILAAARGDHDRTREALDQSRRRHAEMESVLDREQAQLATLKAEWATWTAQMGGDPSGGAPIPQTTPAVSPDVIPKAVRKPVAAPAKAVEDANDPVNRGLILQLRHARPIAVAAGALVFAVAAIMLAYRPAPAIESTAVAGAPILPSPVPTATPVKPTPTATPTNTPKSEPTKASKPTPKATPKDMGWAYFRSGDRAQKAGRQAEAISYYRKSCDLGEKEGCHHLGMALRGSSDSEAQAAFRKSCALGDENACTWIDSPSKSDQ